MKDKLAYLINLSMDKTLIVFTTLGFYTLAEVFQAAEQSRINNDCRQVVCVRVCYSVCFTYLGYLGEFAVSGLILFVNDSGATPRGHRLARIIAAWC